MQLVKRCYLILALSLLSACVSAPLALPEKDDAAKQFEIIPDKSVIYIFRDTGFGFAQALFLSVDGHMIGQTGAFTYYRLVIDPGEHQIASHGENVYPLDLRAEPQQIYYIRQSILLGWAQPRTKLTIVEESEGREGVLACKLAEPIFVPR